MSAPGTLAPLAAVRLVAGRELTTRVRSKALLMVPLAITLLAAALSAGRHAPPTSSAARWGGCDRQYWPSRAPGRQLASRRCTR